MRDKSVWMRIALFAAALVAVIQQRDAEGCEAPLYFMRIGSPTYYRK